MVDIWRSQHEELRQFTWLQRQPLVKCRLDFFNVSFGLIGLVERTEIKSGYKSDHSVIELFIDPSIHPRGRGFWKFNCSLLKDEQYVTLIKKTIIETVEDNKGALPDIMWETIKCRIRGIYVFLYDVLEAWCSYNFFHPESLEEMLSQSLWFNSYILIGKNVVYLQLWFN